MTVLSNCLLFFLVRGLRPRLLGIAQLCAPKKIQVTSCLGSAHSTIPTLNSKLVTLVT